MLVDIRVSDNRILMNDIRSNIVGLFEVDGYILDIFFVRHLIYQKFAFSQFDEVHSATSISLLFFSSVAL